MKLCTRPGAARPGTQAAARPRSAARKLVLELLEDRLALSSSPALPYEAWQNERFTLDNVQIADLTATTGQTDVVLQADLGAQGSSFGSVINLDRAFANFPYRGTGYSVAVIDTGIDYNHTALGGGWGRRVVGGWDFVNNDADPMDDNGHGTHVAGIIGSSDANYSGVAPNVNLIALKVLGADGSGSFGAVEQALQWVAAYQAQFNIVAINLSLGAGNFASNPYSFLEDEFATLKSQGVFIAAASGNSFYSYSSAQGLGYPAISSQTVAVGAVWNGNFGGVNWASGARDISTANDRITSFTQRSSGLDILAPGALITSTYLNNTFRQMAGTSMATPVVAGAAALLHQALDSRNQASLANQNYILGLMQSSGATLIDGDDENDNVANTGLSFKRLDLYAALSSVRPEHNTAPTLAPIANQTMTAGLPLTIALSAADVDGDPITFSATSTGNNSGSSAASQLGQQLGLGYAGSYYVNSVGYNEKWVLGNSSQWYCLLPTGKLHRWMGNAADTMTAANQVGSLSTGVYADPAQLWTPPTTSNVPATITIVGNQLTLSTDPNYLGSFTVTVTASDGLAGVTQAFVVNVANRAPTLETIADQTMTHAQRSLSVNLGASDPDGNPLTFSAQALPPSQQAYNLDQSLALTYTGNYWTNYYGAQEKWLRGGTTWYCLLPNGELRKAGGGAMEMLASGSLVAVLDSSIYQEPSLLWNAQPPVTPSVTFAFSGNQLIVTPALDVVGTFPVEVTVSDGTVSVKKTFSFTVTNSSPGLAALTNQTMAHGRSLTVALGATDADGDALTIAARTLAPSQQAVNLDQSLGLTYTGNYWTSYYGAQEKWLRGTTGWYCLLPTGEVRRPGNGAQEMLSAANLVATFDAGYYAEPSLLWNAAGYSAPQVAYTLSGTSQLTITPPAAFTGSFVVEVSAGDGAATTKQVFTVTVTNNAPVLSPLPNRTMARNQTLSVALAATDADGDALTYSAQAISLGQVAFELKQSLGLTYTGNYWTNYWGHQEKWLRGNAGWYCLLPDGELRKAGGGPSEMLRADSLVGALDGSFYQNPSLIWNAQGGSAPVAVSVAGNQLSVQSGNVSGTYRIRVTAGDGLAQTEQSFLVTVTNNAPGLGGLTSQAQGQTQSSGGAQVFTLDASDADGDALVLTARAVAFNQEAYDLDQQIGLSFTGDYQTNVWGASEKWLKGQDGKWYCLLPNGQLRQGRANMADTLKDDALIATLDPVFYNDPSLLHSAQTPVTPLVTLVIEGNQLTVTPVAGYRGTFYVEVTANDGFVTTKKSYRVTV